MNIIKLINKFSLLTMSSRFSIFNISWLVALIFSAMPVYAIVINKSIEELSTMSDIIVIGEVKSTESDWNSDKTIIITKVHLSSVILPQPGMTYSV